jgi:two-component system CheB/CheR fusion protein
MNEMRQKEMAVREAVEYAEGMIETIHEPMIVLDGDLRVRKVNEAYFRVLAADRGETEGRPFYDLGNGAWNQPDLRDRFDALLTKDATFEKFRVATDWPKLGRREMLLNGRSIPLQSGKTPKLILVAIQDITGDAPR